MMSDRTLRSARDLEAAGLVAGESIAAAVNVAWRYAVAVTPEVVRLIDADDPRDPIGRQFLPDARELTTTPEERADPIGDDTHSPCQGIVHRYPDRVLLKLAQVCAVYCRFCFRRETIGAGRAMSLSGEALHKALRYIAERRGIWEVILSGGDPLVVAPRRLSDVAARLAAMSHVKILRVHTRVPVVAPNLVGPPLIEALRQAGKTVYIAIHANHPRELTAEMVAACARLSEAGFVLVSQTVLLRGVNDAAGVLAELMRGFVEARIRPYYLHHPDLAPGTAHFRLTIAEGQALVRQLRGRLSGLCQPHYVLDIPGGYGKSPIGPNYLQSEPSGSLVEDYNGGLHEYPPKP